MDPTKHKIFISPSQPPPPIPSFSLPDANSYRSPFMTEDKTFFSFRQPSTFGVSPPCSECRTHEIANLRLQLQMKDKDLEIARCKGHIDQLEMIIKILTGAKEAEREAEKAQEK